MLRATRLDSLLLKGNDFFNVYEVFKKHIGESIDSIVRVH